MTANTPTRNLFTRLRSLLFPHTLRQQILMLLSIVMFITLIIVALGVYTFVVNSEQSTWQARENEAVVDAGKEVAIFLTNATRLLQLTAIEIDEIDRLSDLVSGLVTLDDSMLEVVLVNVQGEIVGSAAQDNPVLTNLFTIQQSQWFIQARSGNTYLSTLQFSSTNEPYIILALPAPEGGVVAARIKMDVLGEIISNIRFGGTGTSYLVNSSGQILAHNDFDIVLQNTSISGRPELAAMLTDSENNWSGNYTNFQGNTVLGSTARVPVTADWWVLTEITISEAFATSRIALLLMTAIVVAFSLIVLFVFRRVLSQFIFQPLNELQSGAAQVEQGNLEYKVPVKRVDEIGQVTQTFNTMVTSLYMHNEERETLIGELKQTTTMAQESARLKSEFLSTMSHELRTPLNAIIGFCSIMLEGMGGEIDEDARYMIDRITSNSQRLLGLINDVLDIARIESGRMEIASRPITPRDLAETWRSQIGVLADQKGIAFKIDVDPLLPEQIMGDPDRLSQIATNLLSNAVKFTDAGSVKLKISQQLENWTMEVSDTGVGIPPHAINYIFDEFRQVDGTYKRSYGGTGLGLAIVRQLCRMMEGNVTVTSELDKGSVFTVTLPLIPVTRKKDQTAVRERPAIT
ncbi:MAG: HAMP domain-containing protein [Anaerolineae bacterium]|nr:HAMP domain-containing protein [Anaerolineae bacterium]